MFLFSIFLFTFVQCTIGQIKDRNEETIRKNSTRLSIAPLRCSCSPSYRGYSEETYNLLKVGMDSINLPQRENSEITAEQKKVIEKNMQYCFERDGAEACVNADEKLRSEGSNYCMFDKETGKNLYFNNSSPFLFTAAPCDSDVATKSNICKLRKHGCKQLPKNQGCVAVEHLQGHTLQHKKHLNRSVMCWEGFCATPDHALLVDDKWTSMKKLCLPRGKLNCSEALKLVNNLKVYGAARIQYNHRIVITPYDDRFPRIAIWIVQVIEDIVDLIIHAISLGFAVIIGLLMYNAAENFVAAGDEQEDAITTARDNSLNLNDLSCEPNTHLTEANEVPKSFKDKARDFLKNCGIDSKEKQVTDNLNSKLGTQSVGKNENLTKQKNDTEKTDNPVKAEEKKSLQSITEHSVAGPSKTSTFNEGSYRKNEKLRKNEPQSAVSDTVNSQVKQCETDIKQVPAYNERYDTKVLNPSKDENETKIDSKQLEHTSLVPNNGNSSTNDLD